MYNLNVSGCVFYCGFILCSSLSGICTLRLEPQRDACTGAVSTVPYQWRHLWDEGPMALCGHGLLSLLLAHRGSLELLY